MNDQIAREHHYVPQLLIRQWRIGSLVAGYSFDHHRRQMRVRRLGPSAFCKKIDLWSLRAAKLKPDALEAGFFQSIDDRGAVAMRLLIDRGVGALDAEARSDFARLLMSLEVRRPDRVAAITQGVAEAFRKGLNTDAEIRAALNALGMTGPAAQHVASATGISLEDRALLHLQRQVDNREVGTQLINAHWRVYKLTDDDGTLILGDRPLIRFFGYTDPKGVWAVPLGPRTLFLCANSPTVAHNFDRQSLGQLRLRMNESTINQVDRYAFMVDDAAQELLLGHFLRANPPPVRGPG